MRSGIGSLLAGSGGRSKGERSVCRRAAARGRSRLLVHCHRADHRSLPVDRPSWPGRGGSFAQSGPEAASVGTRSAGTLTADTLLHAQNRRQSEQQTISIQTPSGHDMAPRCALACVPGARWFDNGAHETQLWARQTITNPSIGAPRGAAVGPLRGGTVSTGEAIRLRRLFDEGRNAVVVAIDHGLYNGPRPGFENLGARGRSPSAALTRSCSARAWWRTGARCSSVAAPPR